MTHSHKGKFINTYTHQIHTSCCDYAVSTHLWCWYCNLIHYKFQQRGTGSGHWVVLFMHKKPCQKRLANCSIPKTLKCWGFYELWWNLVAFKWMLSGIFAKMQCAFLIYPLPKTTLYQLWNLPIETKTPVAWDWTGRLTAPWIAAFRLSSGVTVIATACCTTTSRKSVFHKFIFLCFAVSRPTLPRHRWGSEDKIIRFTKYQSINTAKPHAEPGFLWNMAQIEMFCSTRKWWHI